MRTFTMFANSGPEQVSLSMAQEEILAACRLPGVPSGYNLCEEITFTFHDSTPDPLERLATAIRTAVDRREWLHRQIVETLDGPQGKLHDPLWDLEVIDGRSSAFPSIDLIRMRVLQTIFDPFAEKSLTYGVLMIASENRIHWIQSYHHVAIDGGGIADLVSHASDIYRGLDTPVVQQLDDEYLRETDEVRLTASRDYWSNEAKKWSGPTSLSDVVFRAASIRPVRHAVPLNREMWEALSAQANEARTSVSRWVTVACFSAIASMANSPQPSIGFVVAGSGHGPTHANILPLTASMTARSKVENVLDAISDQLRRGRTALPYRYEDIARIYLGRNDDRSFGPLVNFYSFDYSQFFEGCIQSVTNLATGNINDLSISFHDRGVGSHVDMILEGHSLRYTEEELVRHGRILSAHLASMLEATRASSVSRLGPQQAGTGEQPTARQNITASGVGSILEAAYYWATQQPESIASQDKNGSITYRALIDQATIIADRLKANGIKPGDAVAISIPRTTHLYPALLGVLIAGAVQVPLDLDLPPKRREQLQVLAEVRALLTLQDSNVKVELIEAVLPSQTSSDSRRQELLSDAMYILFTSGSTGTPKGVPVSNSSVSTYIANAVSLYPGLARSALVHSSISFDLTVTSLYGPLYAGGTAMLVDNLDEAPLPASFVKLTPSHVDLFLRTSLGIHFETVVLGGEALRAETVRRIHAAFPFALVVNEYGPTETTVGCVIWTATSREPYSDPIPAGVAMPGVEYLILDPMNRRQPIGYPGELLISGHGLSNGYLQEQSAAFCAVSEVNDGSLTVMKANALDHNYYSTGDIARQDDTGNIYVLGRKDHQVKIGGHRIQLEEVDGYVSKTPGVGSSFVFFDKVPDPHLTVLVSASSYAKRNVDTLRLQVERHLSDFLPSAVAPRVLVVDELPLNSNGKVDIVAARRLASELLRKKSSEDLVPRSTSSWPAASLKPVSAVKEVAAEFGAVLQREAFGESDSFRAYGGTSLTAARLAYRIKTRFGQDLTMSEVMRADTPVRVCDLLSVPTSQQAGLRYEETSVETSSKFDKAEVTWGPHQMGLLYEYLMSKDSTAYIISRRLTFQHGFEEKEVVAALRAVQAKHTALMSMLQVVPGELPQPRIDRNVAPEVTTGGGWGSSPFDLFTRPAVKMHLEGESPFRSIVVSVHHLFVDGTGFDLLLRDFCEHLMPSANTANGSNSDVYAFNAWLSHYSESRVEQDRRFWADNLTEAKMWTPQHSSGSEKRSLSRVKVPARRPRNLKSEGHSYASLAHLVVRAADESGVLDPGRQAILAMPVDLRRRLEDVFCVGHCVNLVPVVLGPRTGVPVDTFARRVAQAVEMALAHSARPYAAIVETVPALYRPHFFDLCFSYSDSETLFNVEVDNISHDDWKYVLNIEATRDTGAWYLEHATGVIEQYKIDKFSQSLSNRLSSADVGAGGES